MDILIGIGVAAMFAAVCVLGWLLERAGKAGKELAAENAALRNELHNALNIRKAKSRGITGKYRKAIEAHKAAAETITGENEAGEALHDVALWSVLDSEAV